MTLTIWNILTLVGCSIVGFAFREMWSISKRDKTKPFSWSYYWKNNRDLIITNAIGTLALLVCSKLIFHGEAWALTKAGVADASAYIPMLLAPTGIIVGFGGAALVRKLLKKGAEKAGLDEVYEQIEEKVEDKVEVDVARDQVTTTNTKTTITTPVKASPAPPPDPNANP